MSKRSESNLRDLLEERAKLSSISRRRKEPFERRKIHVEDPLPNGWTLDRTLKSSKIVRRDKTRWLQFEDKIWNTFYDFGFEFLNRDYEPELIINRGPIKKKRFDVIAKAESFLFFVECKSRESQGSQTIRETVSDLRQLSGHLNRVGKDFFDDPNLKAKLIIATQNLVISEQDLQYAHKLGVSVWDNSNVEYIRMLSQLETKLGEVARFQLYSLLFPKDQHYFESIPVPAIRQKVGGKTYYSFLARPSNLLRIAYVHRRGSGIRDVESVTLTYQRMLVEKKLKRIRNYVEGKLHFPFPNSIIISFDKPPRFDPAPSSEGVEITHGILTLPRHYGAAWIIDGQHRLYGYSLSERKSKDLLPIVAFENLSELEQAKLFIDINQNQKAVSPNLIWDLKEQLYHGTDDSQLLREWVISRAVKRLALDAKSPLKGSINIPSLPSSDSASPITLNTICSSLDKSGLLGEQYLEIVPTEINRTVDQLFLVLRIHFEYFAKNIPQDWEAGKKGFTRSANGAAALIWLLRQVLHYLNYIERRDLYNNSSKMSEFASFISDLYRPIVEHFIAYPQLPSQLRRQRGVGGQRESANTLCVIIKDKFPEFPLLQKPELLVSRKELDDDENSLDLAIKHTELRLRDFVRDVLKSSLGGQWYSRGLPGDIKVQVDDLVERERRKHPYNKIDTPDAKFEYVQLGDLRKIVESGNNWPYFENTFGEKTNFANKMQEFIEVRNSRAHPRPQQTPGSVILSGAGAIEWLNSCLNAGGKE